MTRWFNTAGPCDERWHYMLPAAARLAEARGLIERGGYFVVHAPRQTGKTTTLRALARELTAEGRYAALHVSCETGEPAQDDYGAAQRAVLGAIRRETGELPSDLRPPDPWPEAGELALLATALSAWAERCPRPLVLVLDEIDALRGESLKSVLRQLRDGYPNRPDRAPWSVILCGLRDVRDYKAAAGGDASRLGTASPFNVKVESLRLANFERAQVADLYGQHSEATGQPFEPEAVDRAFELTGGQPWLVNALVAEVVDKLKVPAPEPITPDHIDAARERLILARATHLDSLVARLHEPRVRRLMEPLIAGEMTGGDTFDDDFLYARDLGLIAPTPPLRVANPIYREVVVRVLSGAAEANITAEPGSFVLPDGRLDFRLVLDEFVAFWRLHGEALMGHMSYREVAAQLILMAFLQRVVNGGGFVEREYGVGRGRIDLLVRWPWEGADGARRWQHEALELKVWRDGRPDPIARGLAQLDAYLTRLSMDRGVLVVFDQRSGQTTPATERAAFEARTSPDGREVLLLRA